MKCNVCKKHEATRIDYRFRDSVGLQGKIRSCDWCADLNDITIRDIVRSRYEKGDNIDPRRYYHE